MRFRLALIAVFLAFLGLASESPVNSAGHIHGAKPQCFNLIEVGDSIGLGFMVTTPFPAQIATALGSTSSNQSVGGAGWNKLGNAGVPNLTTRAAAEVDPLLLSVACSGRYPQPFIHLQAATNDVCGGGSTGAQTFAFLQTYINARFAAGWSPTQFLVSPILPRGSCTGPGTEAQAYNDLIVAAAPSYGYALVRYDLDPFMGCNGCQNNATYFNSGDLIHPTDSGEKILANLTCVAMIVVVTGRCPSYN